MSKVIHIAGAVVKVGAVSRQRCAWCGVMLDELDLRNVAWEGDNEPTCGFTPLALISVEGVNPTSYSVVEHVDGGQIPAGFCGDEGKPRIALVTIRDRLRDVVREYMKEHGCKPGALRLGEKAYNEWFNLLADRVPVSSGTVDDELNERQPNGPQFAGVPVVLRELLDADAIEGFA